jgi:uncharacterized membrane protein (UPF0127 family)
MSRPHFLVPALKASGEWGLRIERSAKWLATNAEIAGSSSSRRKGLLGRESLAAGHALVIAPTQGVHTFGMQFPIDVVGVGRDGKVVSIRRSVPRRRIVFSLRAFAIVELAAGATDQAGLEVADHLEVVTGRIPVS